MDLYLYLCQHSGKSSNCPVSWPASYCFGRFWRWHINFCPGWKKYFASLDEAGKDELRQKLPKKKQEEYRKTYD